MTIASYHRSCSSEGDYTGCVQCGQGSGELSLNSVHQTAQAGPIRLSYGNLELRPHTLVCVLWRLELCSDAKLGPKWPCLMILWTREWSRTSEKQRWDTQRNRQAPWDSHSWFHLFVTCMHACSDVSNSLWPHGLQPTRLLYPWDSGVGCHFLLQGSSWPRDQTCISCVSCIGRQIIYHWATWEAQRWE